MVCLFLCSNEKEGKNIIANAQEILTNCVKNEPQPNGMNSLGVVCICEEVERVVIIS